jgi:hypothetical protein
MSGLGNESPGLSWGGAPKFLLDGGTISFFPDATVPYWPRTALSSE